MESILYYATLHTRIYTDPEQRSQNPPNDIISACRIDPAFHQLRYHAGRKVQMRAALELGPACRSIWPFACTVSTHSLHKRHCAPPPSRARVAGPRPSDARHTASCNPLGVPVCRHRIALHRGCRCIYLRGTRRKRGVTCQDSMEKGTGRGGKGSSNTGRR